MGFHANNANKEQTLLFRSYIDDLLSWGHSWTSIYRGANFDRLIRNQSDRPVQVLRDAYKRKPSTTMVRLVERFHSQQARKVMNKKVRTLVEYLRKNPGASKSDIDRDLYGIGQKTIGLALSREVIVERRNTKGKGRPYAYFLADERPEIGEETAPMGAPNPPPNQKKIGAQNASKSVAGANAADVAVNNERMKPICDKLADAKRLLEEEVSIKKYNHIPPFLYKYYRRQLEGYSDLIGEILKDLGEKL